MVRCLLQGRLLLQVRRLLEEIRYLLHNRYYADDARLYDWQLRIKNSSDIACGHSNQKLKPNWPHF